MSDAAPTAAPTADRPAGAPPRGRFGPVGAAPGRLMTLVRETEVDLRLFGMVLALAGILVGIELASPANFLQPVNILNLSVQAAPVAIIATGMVLIIVSRNIDLSVGSIVGVVSMVNAILFFKFFPGTI